MDRHQFRKLSLLSVMVGGLSPLIFAKPSLAESQNPVLTPASSVQTTDLSMPQTELGELLDGSHHPNFTRHPSLQDHLTVLQDASDLTQNVLDLPPQPLRSAAIIARKPQASTPVNLAVLSPQQAEAFIDTDFIPRSTADSQDWLETFPHPQPQLIADDPVDPSDGPVVKWTSGRPDGHAPLGVMGDHTHGKGEVMFAYRYMRMEMGGNLDGTTSLTDMQVLQQFPVTPLHMTGEMHMLGAMYAPTNESTLMLMAPYVLKGMEHLTRMGTRFTTHSDGFGDLKFTGLYKFFDQSRQRIHFNAGVSFPTGSINQRDTTPAGPNQILPYPMQLGSGTFDLLPGITYLGQTDHWSWGAQVMGNIRLGTNDNSYRLGNQVQLTGWGARRWNQWVSTSVRLDGRDWGNISGADPRLNPRIIPTADPNRRGGTRLDLLFGINLFAPKGTLKGQRLAVEVGLPIYQSLDGPQLETDWLLTVGWQGAF